MLQLMPHLATLDGEVLRPANSQLPGPAAAAAGSPAGLTQLIASPQESAAALAAHNMYYFPAQAPEMGSAPAAVVATLLPSLAEEVAALRAQLQEQATSQQLEAQQQASVQAELAQAQRLIAQLQVRQRASGYECVPV
jgi:hypothetical protein